jgi:thiol-disulfide isomerase/thioredoxin
VFTQALKRDFMKKLLLISFFLVFNICISQCKTKGNINRSQSVYFSPNINDTLIKKVIVDELANDLFIPFLIRSKDEKESLEFEFSLMKPKLFKFYSLTPFSMPNVVFITPGDSINYQLGEDKNFVFKGKNQAHYNFHAELNKLKLYYPNILEIENYDDFKQKCEKIYIEKKKFLETYKKKEKISDLFFKKMNAYLKFEYFNRIISSPDHIDEIEISVFNNEEFLDINYFKICLNKYLLFVSKDKNEPQDFSKKHLETQLNIIEKFFKGGVKDYAITQTLHTFFNNLTYKNITLIQESCIGYLSKIEDEKYKIELENISKKLAQYKNALPDEVLNTKVTDINGNTITLKEIFKQNENVIKVIDFWASWCSPCIEEIKISYENRQKLAQENKVIFYYFSIDKDQEKWKNKVSALKKYGINKNQYLIDENSILKSYFNIYSIPRYTILDKENKLFLINAPSPSDSLKFNKSIEWLVQ